MEITKSHFRKAVLQYRKLVDDAIYLNRNELLSEKVASFLGHFTYQKVHTFLSIRKNREPDISSLHHLLWAQGKELVVSRTDFSLGIMHHYQLTRATLLEKNKKGIPEPVDAEETSVADVDVIFVPLLVADGQGNRIGYGGGYYDQLLKETNAIKIGLSLSNPVDKIIQTDDWDIPLNYLITPFKTYNYG